MTRKTPKCTRKTFFKRSIMGPTLKKLNNKKIRYNNVPILISWWTRTSILGNLFLTRKPKGNQVNFSFFVKKTQLASQITTEI